MLLIRFLYIILDYFNSAQFISVFRLLFYEELFHAHDLVGFFFLDFPITGVFLVSPLALSPVTAIDFALSMLASRLFLKTRFL